MTTTNIEFTMEKEMNNTSKVSNRQELIDGLKEKGNSEKIITEILSAYDKLEQKGLNHESILRRLTSSPREQVLYALLEGKYSPDVVVEAMKMYDNMIKSGSNHQQVMLGLAQDGVNIK